MSYIERGSRSTEACSMKELLCQRGGAAAIFSPPTNSRRRSPFLGFIYCRTRQPLSISFTGHLSSPTPLLVSSHCAPRYYPTTAVRAESSAFQAANDDVGKARLAQVSKRLEKTARYFKRLGGLGFWGQLVFTVSAAVILSFSAIVTRKITSPATFYATAGGTAAAFVSVFWSFGYIRLSERLQRTANVPSKAPPRADVVESLKNGIVVNLLGLGSAIIGMQATVGFLVGKALASSAVPYYQGISFGQSPVLALDIFLVQASTNTILSHFLGLLFSLELLRSVTSSSLESVPTPDPGIA